ncbi:MAG: glycosyltransferase family 1 protein [Pseudoalteromonas nigrifaciens]|uniref:glycosyltransferase family 1 protein n=1 Tax=Pseudoalteromonas nigrifaciens TaxID=28109 RepID=UPI003F9D64F4
MSSKRLLFIPVSSPAGIGEYMRSLLLAQTLKAELADKVDVHFVLNKHSSYAEACPFETTLLNHSATKERGKVVQVIEKIKPDVVIFDCAGRAAHMKAAKNAGAKVVFISQHAKKRAKGLKLNRAGLIDFHWVVQPNYCIEPLSWLEKAKLALFPLASPANVGPFIVFATIEQKKQVLNNFKLESQGYFIVSAGSGGHVIEGSNCADVYFQAALKISQRTGLKGVVVFGSNYNKKLPKTDQLLCLSSQGNEDFLALLSEAKMAVLSAGDTLLQAIAVRTPVVACAISKDQLARLESCVKTQVVVRSELEVDAIVARVEQVINEPLYTKITQEYKYLEIKNSFDVVTEGVKALLFGSK